MSNFSRLQRALSERVPPIEAALASRSKMPEVNATVFGPGEMPNDSEKMGDRGTYIRESPAFEFIANAASRLVSFGEADDLAADRFRLLRTRLRSLRAGQALKTILITSTIPGEGKSTIALNLAATLADRGTARVLLIDADLHHSGISREIGLASAPGLAEFLGDNLRHRLTHRIEPLGFYFLPAGIPVSPPSELFRSEALSELRETVGSEFDWVVIDAPPLIMETTALQLSQVADGVLLVVRSGKSPANEIEQAVSLIGRKSIVGVVLNAVPDLDRKYQSYDYYKRRAPRISGTRSESQLSNSDSNCPVCK